MFWKWVGITFSIVSTGSGLALLQVQEMSALFRALAKSLVFLGIIIAIPSAIDAARTVYHQFDEMGVWAKFLEWKNEIEVRDKENKLEAERKSEILSKQIGFYVSNDTSYDLYIEFFSDDNNKDFWPGGGSYYILNYGKSIRVSLQCSYNHQHVCFGAWPQNQSYTNYWGAGKSDLHACDKCGYYCGNDNNSINLTN
jgi:hypothetical protein